MRKKLNIIMALIIIALGSCKNSEVDFPDFENQTVYFAYQGPIRTITMGEDIFDTTLDNQGRLQIMGTTAGVYSNDKDITIGIRVNNLLTQGNNFQPPYNNAVVAMPSNYYTLSSNNIVIPKGSLIGGVDVQLTAAFFADPLSVRRTYVIPIEMTNVDQGKSVLTSKNFTLYAVKYINTWDGNYLRRGRDVVAGKGGNTALNQTIVRRNQYVEKDEINKLNTRSLTQTEFPVTFRGTGGVNINATLLLTFDAAGNCTISAADATFTATGTGKFVKRGEKKSWGNQDRDALYLNYQVELADRTISSLDTLVMRDRGVRAETFTAIRN